MSSPSIAVERRVPLLDLHAQHRTIRNETIAEVIRVIDSQHFILGDDVKKLEASIAEYCSTPFAIGCASGSDALFLALLAAGIGPGDKVLTTPYTFFATVGAICRAGATPVFADIEPETFNIDPARVEEAFRKHPDIRAVIPVHLFGACADMDPICKMAASAGSTVIEDAAQSIGSEYNGRRAGSIGDIGCFSFFPARISVPTATAESSPRKAPSWRRSSPPCASTGRSGSTITISSASTRAWTLSRPPFCA